MEKGTSEIGIAFGKLYIGSGKFYREVTGTFS